MEHSVESWVEKAPEDRKDFSQAVHIILQAISNSAYLKPKMIMKGGMLMGIRYASSRYTEDIDFSTAEKLADIDQEEFRTELDEALQEAGDHLPYPIKCLVQSINIQPRGGEATFPSFNLKIGYANKGNASALKRLERRQSPKTVKIDYSFNEVTYRTDEIVLHDEDDESVQTYAITDLIAEKIRSIIQQPYRERHRRQDIYDLHYLLTTIEELNSEERYCVLDTLFKKSEGRLPIEDLHEETLDRVDIREMSHANYHQLASEVAGELPVFDEAYDLVVEFYKSLPWNCIVGGSPC